MNKNIKKIYFNKRKKKYLTITNKNISLLHVSQILVRNSIFNGTFPFYSSYIIIPKEIIKNSLYIEPNLKLAQDKWNEYIEKKNSKKILDD